MKGENTHTNRQGHVISILRVFLRTLAAYSSSRNKYGIVPSKGFPHNVHTHSELQNERGHPNARLCTPTPLAILTTLEGHTLTTSLVLSLVRCICSEGIQTGPKHQEKTTSRHNMIKSTHNKQQLLVCPVASPLGGRGCVAHPNPKPLLGTETPKNAALEGGVCLPSYIKLHTLRLPREMAKPLRFPVVHKLRIAQALVCGPALARLTGFPPGEAVIFVLLLGLLGHESRVSLELGAAQHACIVVLSQGLVNLVVPHTGEQAATKLSRGLSSEGCVRNVLGGKSMPPKMDHLLVLTFYENEYVYGCHN